MRILVGVLYCIENEYEACLQSIHAQTHRDWDLFVIEKLPNKQAHEKLYQGFMDRAQNFDLLIKVDADMVICRSTFFDEIIEEVKLSPKHDHFQIGVYDYFTDQVVSALHVYRRHVRWEKTNERYSVDLVHYPTRVKAYMSPLGPLAPGAYHCPSPSPFQAFHFGVHKVAKLLQRKAAKERRKARSHTSTIQQLLQRYQSGQLNEPHQYAVLGLIWAFKDRVTYDEVNFDHPNTIAGFRKSEQLSQNERKRLIENWILALPVSINAGSFRFFLVEYFTYQKPVFLAKINSLWWYGVRQISFPITSRLRKMLYLVQRQHKLDSKG